VGLVTGLLFFPVLGPVRAFGFLLERLREEAEAVLRDEGRVFAEIIDLSRRHHAGQLSDAEYADQESQLLERLSSIREYKDDLLQGDFYEDEEEFEEDW
jgi:hypothetical protein